MKRVLSFAGIFAFTFSLLSAQCADNNFVSPFNPDLTPGGVGMTDSYNCAWAGDYFYFSCTSGVTYQISACASVNTNDPIFTLVNHSGGAYITHNSGICGPSSNKPEIYWVASYTGQARILVDHEPGCAHSSICIDIAVTNHGVLPIELISFEGYTKGDQVNLEWKIAEEHGVQHYDIERSADGVNFASIGTVDSKGEFKDGERVYTFTDMDPLAGRNFYRLSEVDVNGNVKTHEVIEVMAGEVQTLIRDLYPVPASSNLNLVAFFGEQSPVQIEITDMLGRVVLSTETVPAGYEENIELDIQNLRGGAYLLRLNQNGRSDIRRFVKE